MSETNIIIVRARESVIVRSLEKRITDMGLNLSIVGENLKEIEKVADDTNIFIIYLSDINEDVVKTLVYISDLVRENGQYVIVIGEKKNYDDLIRLVPEIKKLIWLDRPLDMPIFNMALDEVLSALRKKAEKQSILIVDDDPSYAKMVREWLKDHYQTYVVTAGMQAISFLMKHEVDLILLDYEMPIVDGPQILEMLRSDPATSNIPVIFLTGVQDKESVGRVLSLKPKGYLLKSMTRANLLSYIDDFFIHNRV